MTKASKSTRIGDLLRQGEGGLGKLLARAAELESLTARVSRALPAEDAAHLVAVRAGDGQLVVTVDSAAWASRLRFMEDLVRQAAGTDSGRYRVRVRPPVGN